MIKRSLKLVSIYRFMMLGTFGWASLSQYAGAASDHNSPAPNTASPTMVSMDYCADQYLLALVDKDQIIGLSADSTSVYSFFSDQAKDIPQLSGSSEEILALKPDIVLRHWRGGPQIDALFKRASIRALTIPYASSPDEALQSLVDLGDQIGRGDRARAFADKRTAMRNKLETMPSSNLKALYVTPSGYTAGVNTSVNAIITSAGLSTVADDYSLQGWQPLPLEAIAQTKPDLIVTSYFELPRPASRWSLSQSPLVSQLLKNQPVINLPASMLSCNGLFDIDATAYIQSEALKLGLIAN